MPTRTHRQVTARGEFVCFCLSPSTYGVPPNNKEKAPNNKEKDSVQTHFLFEGLGRALSSHSAELSGI